MLSLASAWVGAEPWTVVSSDFSHGVGSLERVNESGVVLRQRDALRELPWSDVVLIRQENAAEPSEAEPFVLYLRNGQRLAGGPAALDAETLTWQSEQSKMKVPLSAIRGWGRPGRELPATQNDDVVILSNGDELRGIVDAGEGGLVITQGTTNAKIPWESLRAVALAEVGEAPVAKGQLLVRLTNGSALLAETVERRGDVLRLVLGGRDEMSINVESVAQIENRGGNARHLAWLQPADARYTPYLRLTDETLPPYVQRDEVAIGSRVYVNVLELRPRTQLTYNVPADGELHLQYAAVHPGPLTDMTLVIRVGAGAVHEAAGINSPRLSQSVRVPVQRGDRVVIEVGYGANYDADDQLWLVNAAFVAR